MSGITLPACWGHRGASAAFPENTLASFEAAIRDGSDGLESDIHLTKDGHVIMFHDHILGRTTTGGIGAVNEQNYIGQIDQLVTNKQPAQKIPTFAQTLELLARPENQHVSLNIDVKLDNDPELVFKALDRCVKGFADHESLFKDRLILGLWHPKYLVPAQRDVPYMRRFHIGGSPSIARKYFWDMCEGFSMQFHSLATTQGRRFREDCIKSDKRFTVWTVNDRTHMIQATVWGASAILTDKTDELQNLRREMEANWPKVSSEVTQLYAWSNYFKANALQTVADIGIPLELWREGGSLVVPPAATV